MATCGRCAADVPVPAHITVGRMRCRSCGESVDVVAPPPEGAPPRHVPPPTPAHPRAAGRPGRPGPVSLMRTCSGCGERFPVERGTRCPRCGLDGRRVRDDAEWGSTTGDGGWAPERSALNHGVVGGIALLAIAGIWFYAGWQAGRIFYYPPILALLGVFGIVKGMAEGNLAGKRQEPFRPRRRRRR